ncbi:PTS system mannose/fructose/N-acetylgalactosamine-transporter subunit IIB [Buttiauxella sp.]|uniref:PTS system mannose/fructose/N-acetylgalactosamine-transporter subunit IIB n=1 Tax=Buttiauxella sp. TaxID=1972222 RepID=UPI003C75D274
MINLFRIDERLIHGQVAIKWSKYSDVSHIVVANDNAANNLIVEKTLKMAAPATIKTAIKSIDSAVDLLNDPRVSKMKLLVLVASPHDAVEVIKNIPGVPYVNVGNYGRVIQEKNNENRTRYAGNLYCNDEDVRSFQELMRMGLKCIYQPTPEDSAEDMVSFFK